MGTKPIAPGERPPAGRFGRSLKPPWAAAMADSKTVATQIMFERHDKRGLAAHHASGAQDVQGNAQGRADSSATPRQSSRRRRC